MAPIHNVDEPSDAAVFGHALLMEAEAKAKSKPSFIERVLGIPQTPKQTAEEGV